MSHKEHLGPFLLGTYEMELHPWIRAILPQAPTQVVDIGSQFGFYAVGFARSLPGARVVAFDPDPWAREATREMARVNDVTSVDVQEFCTPRWLEGNLLPGALVFSDCEGFERELFCSTPIRALRHSTAIIELHENLAPEITASMRAMFSRTHDFAFVSMSARSFPGADLDFLTSEQQQRAINEVTSSGEWLLLTPKPASACISA
jgi:ribosomal protein L11 methylase PrmA